MDYAKCRFIESICAELIGTFIICSIILTSSSLVPTPLTRQNNTLDLEKVHPLFVKSRENEIRENALERGLVITSAVTLTYVSGGQLNPAVTLGALACGYIRVIPALCYVVAQIVGALLGEVTAKLIVEKQKRSDKEFETRSQFAVGVLAAFTLVSVYLSVMDPRKFDKDVGSAPLAIGLMATTIELTDSKISANPALALATSMHYEDFAQDWVYWTSPLLGGFLAGIVYWAITKYHDPPLVRVGYSDSFVTVKVSNSA